MCARRMNEPDTTDVLVMMGAIEALHECRVELTLIPAGVAHNGGGAIGLRAMWDRLPESTLPKALSTTAAWPNSNGRSFWGEVMQLLYVMDFMIGEAYQQRFLPL